MGRAISHFIGVFLGIIIYSSLIQYSDTEAIDFSELIFDFRPWVIAIAVAGGISIWEKLIKQDPGKSH